MRFIHAGSHVSVRQYSVPAKGKALFDTKQEAIEQSFVAGAQIIERGVGLDDL